MNTLRNALEIINHIESSRAGVTARQLADKTGVNIRSLYRYLSVIAEVKPIYTERDGRLCRYKMLRNS